MLQRAGEGENVAHIVIHQQHLASFEDPVATAGDLEHLLPVMGQLRFDFVQKKCHLVQKPLWRTRALDDDRTRILAQFSLFIAGQVAPGIDDDGWKGADVFGGHALEQVVAEHVRQLEVDDHAIED
ncbi:hypothetical protein D3C84_429180 [compost metagenome]